MNLDELATKLAEKGYEHPAEVNVYQPHNSTYMAYSGEDYKSHTYDPYATFNTEEKDSNSSYETKSASVGVPDAPKPIMNCPVCSKRALFSCGCVLKDMLCENHHYWFVKNGTVIIANPHDDEDD